MKGKMFFYIFCEYFEVGFESYHVRLNFMKCLVIRDFSIVILSVISVSRNETGTEKIINSGNGTKLELN